MSFFFNHPPPTEIYTLSYTTLFRSRPVGDRVGAIEHGLGLAVRGGDGAGVEVVAADGDRSFHHPVADQVVEEHPGAVALAVAEPADAGGQALELDVLAGGVEPAMEVLVVREQLLQGPVGDCDVLGVAGQRHPAEGAESLAEQGTDVGGHEAWELEGAIVAGVAGLVADRVAV